MRYAFALLVVFAGVACAAGAPMPVAFDARHEPCGYCRMVGSNGRFAAQLVAPSQDPVFFDDIGCLRSHLRRGDRLAEGAVAYVVDHRTGAYINAGRALYTENEAVATPMGSHLLAHESPQSRAADPDARGGQELAVTVVFAGLALPGGGL
jgi:copper chaperone NosL